MSRGFDPTKTRKYASDQERRNAAYEYWLAGHTYQQVADEFGYHDRATAYKAIAVVKRSWAEQSEEAREQAFNRIIGPLMEMRRLALPGTMVHPETGEEIERPGDPKAAKEHKGYEERVAKMLGLDMPVKTDITSDGERITIQVVPDWQQGAE